MFYLLYLASLLLLSAQWVEIYEDWLPDAVGETTFEQPLHGASLHYEIRKALEEKGFSVRRWDRKAHRPFLLTWKAVKSWSDFIHWLGLGLPRKQILDNQTAFVLFSNLGPLLKDLDLSRIPRRQKILFAWEPPTVQPEIWDPKIQAQFEKIYTWNDDLVDNIRYFKFYYPVFVPRISPLVPYEERKFLTLIVSRLSSPHPHELYSERERLIRFFEARPDLEFDLYGRHWSKRNFRVWKGEIPDKLAVLKQYRFAIAYENSIETGYITEKLWDCLIAGVVPIYWGAPNVQDFIPAECFIDRRQFESHEALLAYLQAMKKEEWEGYIERAGSFLRSEKTQKFTINHFAKIIAEAVGNP